MVKKIMSLALRHPWRVVWITAVVTLFALVQFPRITVDTDPENMLPDDSPVRVFHRAVKKEFALYDMVVLGVVDEQNPDGVFNVKTLTDIYALTDDIKKIDGVIARDIIAPSTKDNIEQESLGAVRFNWLMAAPPKNKEEALKIRDQALDHPMFRDTVISTNGKALCLYIPIKSKDISYEVATAIRQLLTRYPGEAQYYITGLPVANDQFGVEMFKQMAVSAPLAGMVIFALLWVFFKSVSLIAAPMILAVVTVLMTMGLLIGMGFPVHIMSSMIPIFLMPIAVLDSVHILSEFSEFYPRIRDRKKTILAVMEELFSPMLYTSLTSAVGFFSLSFSPIPPVQVFGVFVAVGVLIAWVLTMLLIPAYIMLLKERSLQKLEKIKIDDASPLLNKTLQLIRGLSYTHAKAVLIGTLICAGLSIYGISRIQVNDNPVRWFSAKHPIRVADRILNKHFGGTYEAYLVLTAKDKTGEVFLQPEMLTYVETLQKSMLTSGLVGKTTSLADMVKKIYYELLGGDKVNNVIPSSKEAVAQCLISFENSHKPDDLWHLTTPDYGKLNIWVQLKSGDNKDMEQVRRFVARFQKDNPPPYPVDFNWAGLSYINVVWQNNMVGGMLKNFMGSFVIVLFMMLFLFRSPTKALLSMIPLTVTILFIYSLLGFFGKDYDMPVAVLSALTLGLSIDFAIHFIQRAIMVHDSRGSWEKTAQEMFEGPGRAIVRNAIVVAVGFLPLLAAPLIPYKTVGFFMFMIMAVSSVATLLIIPAVITVNPGLLFKQVSSGLACRCGSCMLVAAFVALAVAYVMFGYTTAGWKASTLVTAGVIVGFAALCHLASRRKSCQPKEERS